VSRPNKSDIPTWKEDCGCLVDTHSYRKMCPKHEAEHTEIHNRWNSDKIRLESARLNTSD